MPGGRLLLPPGLHDQLRRRSIGVPAARSLLLTVLGEYVLPRAGAVWLETLVEALVCLGYARQAARQAVSRSVRDGWLASERHGRRACASLTGRASELLRAGAERIYDFGAPWVWDGRWLLVVLRVPEEHREVRHQVRTRLAWAGLGSLDGGVWLTPHAEREAELVVTLRDAPVAQVTSFVAHLGSLGDVRRLVAAAWDLEVVRGQYSRFLDDFSGARPMTHEAHFRMQTLLVHAWRKFPFLDPDLPHEVLPAGWPRQRAHALFVRRHRRWEEPARGHFEALAAAPPPVGRRP